MRLAVLCSPGSWYFADLRRAAGDRHDLMCLPFHRLTARLDQQGQSVIGCGTQRLEDFDAVLVRSMPPGSLEQVVFRMDVLGRLQQSGVAVINPPRALEAAVDKYLASAKLLAAGLATPPTVVCQSFEEAMAGFEQLGGDIVVKPLFGSEGRGILRVDEPGLALRVFKALVQLGSVAYLQRFIPHHGFDIRLLVVGEQVLCVRRCNPTDWRTNISRGATAEPYTPDADLVQMARRAAAAVGAPLAGVDVLPGCDGQRYVLEVNAVPGWQATARTLNCDVAALVLDYIDRGVANRRQLAPV
jgi:RimK family alpha-L-glutamate ligase